MKKISILILMMVLFFQCSKNNESSSDKILLKIKVLNPKPGKSIKLYQIQNTGYVAVDSFQLNEEGTYEKYFADKKDDFFRIDFYEIQNIAIITSPNDEVIELEVEGNPNGKELIKGSTASILVQKMDSITEKKDNDLNYLNYEAMQANNNQNIESIGAISDQMKHITIKYNLNLKKMIIEATPTLTSLYGLLSYMNIEMEYPLADSLLTIFNQNLPQNILTKDLNNRLSIIKKTAIGTAAPEISLPDPNGNNITLSSLKGKYVLIDFWAGWCRPCRMENPNVVRLYNRYKNKNFEILGVSLDRTKEMWTSAIKEDNLTWKHVSDLKYFNSQAARDYNISSIPATYLIDPEGNIIAKGLRGHILEEKLKELFD